MCHVKATAELPMVLMVLVREGAKNIPREWCADFFGGTVHFDPKRRGVNELHS